MKNYRTINKGIVEIGDTTENQFRGESLEDKIRKVVETKQPIEAISPMIYTERKAGVQPEYDIRADKWDIAQQAMQTVTEAHRTKRQERQNLKVQETAKPDANSKINDTEAVRN